MAQFSFFAILLCALASAFAVSALWQKARVLALVLTLLVPIGAGALYWKVGRPAALDSANTATPATLPEAISQLERLGKDEPGNFENAATLARAYAQAERWPEAREAYKHALSLRKDPALGVDYAEAMLRTSSDRRFPPEAVRMLEDALKQEPNHQRALFFLGLHQRQSGEPAKAAETWTKLLAQLEPANSAQLRKQIAEVRAEAGLPPVEKFSGPLLDIVVDLDPRVAQEGGPGTVLYVVARDPEQRGPPVAAKRLEVHRYPVQLQLGDDDSVMPTQALSTRTQVVLIARVSHSGNAIREHGDLESAPITVQVAPGRRAHLLINRVVP